MEFLYSIKNQLGETLNIAYDVCTDLYDDEIPLQECKVDSNL